MQTQTMQTRNCILSFFSLDAYYKFPLPVVYLMDKTGLSHVIKELVGKWKKVQIKRQGLTPHRVYETSL